MKKLNQKNLNFAFLNWLVLPVILMIVSINYLLSNVLEPRWQAGSVTISGFPTQKVQAAESIPPPVPSFVWQGNGLITFWFDDAWLSQYEVALPLLEKYNYKAAIAVPTQMVGYDSYMNWYQLKKAQYLGWEITAHSRTHNCDTTPKSPEFYKSEVIGSKEDLIKAGLRSDIYVLPCGNEKDEVGKLVLGNYHSSRTVQRGLNAIPVQDPYTLRIVEVNKSSTAGMVQDQIDEAKKTNSWIILAFHQIGNEKSKYAITPYMFEAVVKAVSGSGMPVVVPSQVLSIKK